MMLQTMTWTDLSRASTQHYSVNITRRLEKSSSCDNDKSKSRCLLSRLQITHGEHPLILDKTTSGIICSASQPFRIEVHARKMQSAPRILSDQYIVKTPIFSDLIVVFVPMLY
ncbi:hypothetical protein TorRG33x02_312460 [Trema orientale]|uniref:Uncharacterized protein n=1 Tax=Trema orientale TaxID=63057 RepID=A0A2P5BQK1_TREOI|nr:hypothetical protein TorRG33x02_312460 [Trema orientale]